MAQPPLLPIENKKNYFDKLIEEVMDYFDSRGINLSFDGYKKTVEAYANLNVNDANMAWTLSRDFNMWGEYFSDMKSLTEKLFLDAETEKKKEYATASILEDSNKVANGDRLANKNPTVVALRKDRNLLQSFLTALDSKIDYCYKCHHHCKATYGWEKQTGSSNIIM